MDDPAKENRLAEEIRLLRQDIGRWVSRMLASGSRAVNSVVVPVTLVSGPCGLGGGRHQPLTITPTSPRSRTFTSCF